MERFSKLLPLNSDDNVTHTINTCSECVNLCNDHISNERLLFDHYKDQEPIYENIISYRRRGKVFSNIFRDLNLLKRRESEKYKKYAKVNCESEMNFLESSYTSCLEDDNIYENLEFFYDENVENESLSAWIKNLAYDIEEYENSDNIMFVKSVPSIFSRGKPKRSRKFNKSEVTLNFLRTLWAGETNVDIMSFLLQTFSNLLKTQYTTTFESEACVLNDSSVRKLRKVKNADKKNYQKFVSVILSISLNTGVICYNKSMKFYFGLAHSRVLFNLPTSPIKSICVIKRHFLLNYIFRDLSDEREFYKILKHILRQRTNSSKLQEQIVNEKVSEEKSENIYQPIWKCQSVVSDERKMICENIYAPLELNNNAYAADDNEWEIDDEFSFLNGKGPISLNDISMANQQNVFNTIWILYSDENPEFNKIIYDPALISSLDALKENNRDDVNSSDIPATTQHQSDAIDIDETKIPHDSVEAWKNLIRHPLYLEDEEDVLLSDNILQMKFSPYNSMQEIDQKTNVNNEGSTDSSIYISDRASRYTDELSNFESAHGSYRSLNSNEELNSVSEKIPDSPKKERERFRDKVKFKLKFKTKATFEQVASEAVVKDEDDGIIFGSSIDKVEKDVENKNVPRIIVECIKVLETENHLTTPGIYRISGNKNTIDALKKKLNEKKSSKKDLKYVSLKDQDVHTLTGLLKMFFRELQPTLMPERIFSQCSPEKFSVAQMKSLLNEMPLNNYSTLKYLFKHFKVVERYQVENLMNSANLAICLGLCLFSQSSEVPNPFDNDISKCNMLCRYLIDHYNEVFESDT